jgi:outer membrane protein TolC
MLLVASLPDVAMADQVVSWRGAIQLALEGNDALKAAGHSVEAQKQEIGVARSSLLPKLNFEERFLRTNNQPSS